MTFREDFEQRLQAEIRRLGGEYPLDERSVNELKQAMAGNGNTAYQYFLIGGFECYVEEMYTISNSIDCSETLFQKDGFEFYEETNPSIGRIIFEIIESKEVEEHSIGVKEFRSTVNAVFIKPSSLKGRLPKDLYDPQSPEAEACTETIRHVADLASYYMHSCGIDKFTQKRDFRRDFTFQSLDNTEGNWLDINEKLKKFRTEEAIGLSDAVKDFTSKVVLPQFIRKCGSKADKVDIHEVSRQLEMEVVKILMGERSIVTMLDLQRDWHTVQYALDDVLREEKYRKQQNWLPLADKFTASNGLTVEFVTNSRVLRELGKEQDHCVGTYTNACLTRPVHVAVVKDGDTVLSTLQVNHFEDKKTGKTQVEVVQHRGRENAAIAVGGPDAVAVREFMESITQNPPNYAEIYAEKARNYKEFLGDPSRIAGFDVFGENAVAKQDEALKMFSQIRTGRRKESVIKNSKYFVPREYKDMTAAEFIDKSGLGEKIQELLRDRSLLVETGSWRG